MKRNVYRVAPSGSRWAVKKDGRAAALKLFDLKSRAVEYARNVAKNNEPSQVVVHLANGQIQTEWTYGEDPFPPTG